MLTPAIATDNARRHGEGEVVGLRPAAGLWILAAALASTANARARIDAAARHDEKNWTP